MTAAAIRCQAIAKDYPRQRVLCDLDLMVAEGEFFALVGVNGAGKTTLIKCMLDLCQPGSGAISLFGIDHREQAARSRLAYLPEKFIPPYYLSGQDFIESMARLYGTAFKRRSVLDMLEVLDLPLAALHKPVRQLSKGMAQKLGLAACLLSRRELIIMDEPMDGLDPRARAHLKNYLLEIKHQHTFFFCTHLLNDVEVLCDNVGILHRGGLQYRGSPAACCRQFNTNDFEQAYIRCVSDAKSVAGSDAGEDGG